MNRAETVRIIQMLNGCYPAAFAKINEEQLGYMITAWTDVFADYPFELIERAIKQYAKTAKFCPSIAELIDEVKGILHDEAEMDAFLAALRRAYGDELPEGIEDGIRRQYEGPRPTPRSGAYQNDYGMIGK